MPLRIQISDLLKRPGSSRTEEGTLDVDVELAGSSIRGPADFAFSIRSLTDGVIIRGTASAEATLMCNRCLKEWPETVVAPIEAVYRVVPQSPDEELPIESGGWIEVEQVVSDELSLALPYRPLCSPDCLGLCTFCGADLNTSPCGGHSEESASPFSALKRLFESEDGDTASRD